MPPKSGRSKKKPSRAARAGTVWLWGQSHAILFVLIVAAASTLAAGAALFFFVSLDIPDVTALKRYDPPVTTVVLDRHGEVVDRVFTQDRTVVPLTALPELLPKAFVAAEDARFYQHGGVDAWSILRALFHNIKSGERGQGGSTITQQVARALLLSPEKTYSRKLKEALLAYRIDSVLSKEEILHIYLNQIYFGAGAYGVEAAARIYFGKHAAELDLAEISLLAGLPQAPSRYSPFKHFRLAKRRQVYVLNRMAEDGYVSPIAARRAYERPLLWAPPETAPGASRYFLQQVRKYVEKRYGREAWRQGGLTVRTTLDQQLQEAATQAVRQGVDGWRQRHPESDAAEPPQGALVALEVATGRVRALVGGSSFRRSQFNRAVQARRQPGSAFKPLIYAAALEAGMTPATMIDDAPLQLPGAAAGEVWEPRNFDNTYAGPTSLRNGLVLSRNIVTIKLLQEVGIERVIDLAHRSGITSALPANLSLALGSADLSPLELTAVYAMFANGGYGVTPFFIDSIVDRHGRVLERGRVRRRQLLDERTAYQVTHLLESVIAEGTGRKARGLGVPAAGKTGTTDSYMDAWFIGYTPRLAAGVWLGFDRKLPLGRGETGGRAAAPVWLAFMRQAKGYLGGTFKVPEGITFVPINNRTGRLDVVEKRPEVSWEPFRKDNLPWQGREGSAAASGREAGR